MKRRVWGGLFVILGLCVGLANAQVVEVNEPEITKDAVASAKRATELIVERYRLAIAAKEIGFEEAIKRIEKDKSAYYVSLHPAWERAWGKYRYRVTVPQSCTNGGNGKKTVEGMVGRPKDYLVLPPMKEIVMTDAHSPVYDDKNHNFGFKVSRTNKGKQVGYVTVPYRLSDKQVKKEARLSVAEIRSRVEAE